MSKTSHAMSFMNSFRELHLQTSSPQGTNSDFKALFSAARPCSGSASGWILNSSPHPSFSLTEYFQNTLKCLFLSKMLHGTGEGSQRDLRKLLEKILHC